MIKETDSETLAAHVVVYRTLKINKELAMECMTELAARRANGDTFDYEAYITEKSKEIPDPTATQIDTSGFIDMIKNLAKDLK